MDVVPLLARMGIMVSELSGDLAVRSPIDGSGLGRVHSMDAAETASAVARAHAAFLAWRLVPPPHRGDLIRLFAEELRSHKSDLGRLITVETGKILQEGMGEVQEMIDLCDFAVGLSRQLHGLTIASERPHHRMMETWLPLGVVGVITAFNFPVAVWAWNAVVALVCGNAVVWKPSEKTPLSALAVKSLLDRAAERLGNVPNGLLEVVIGGWKTAEAVADHPQVALVSATGSSAMGKALAPRIAARLGRSLLELSGNNAAIVTPSADPELTLRAVLFSAIGTAGQRCTTLRRLIVHNSIRDALVERLKQAMDKAAIGDPLAPGTLVGPLIDASAFGAMQAALAQAQADGGIRFGGERVDVKNWHDAWYVRPALMLMPDQTAIVRDETFAPILYVMGYDEFDHAVAMNNEVPQGLAASIFTNDLREAERFLSAAGSDCGVTNVNIGPSGAEIGGAFGGEKQTGGGREGGSDAWKAYMRRATNTINYGQDLPLAQGIVFGTGP